MCNYSNLICDLLLSVRETSLLKDTPRYCFKYIFPKYFFKHQDNTTSYDGCVSICLFNYQLCCFSLQIAVDEPVVFLL
jgi:hypothetical protein